MTFDELLATWHDRAELLAPYAAPAAEALRVCKAELEAVMRDQADEALSLADAARESGYSTDSLRHLVASGQIPNAGKRGAPRIRRADLPKRTRKRGNDETPASTYNPTADALSIVRRSALR
jgi:hypothetical protein